MDITIVLALIAIAITYMLRRYCRNSAKRISKPTNLRVSDVGFDSIHLEWTRPMQGGDDVTSYKILCQSEKDQWESKWTSTEERVTANGLKPNTRYFFKVCPESDRKHGEESDVTDPVKTKSNIPGKPRDKPTVSHVTYDSVLIAWHEPDYGADLIKRYIVSHRPTNGEWKSVIVEGNRCSVSIDELESETKYFFKVCCEGEFGTGPESDLSSQIETQERLSKKFKTQSKKVSSEGDLPEIYALPLNFVMKIEDGKNIAKCSIGDPPPQSFNEKVLMLVGATGAGKTTLLNGIANYVLGVRLEDDFRFKVDVTNTTVSEAHSQTSWITAYTFYPMQGSPLPFPLTVIDTPGFGDTRGITRDKEIVDQLRHFFSTEGEHGIDQLNGVGVVIQSTLPRLTPTQQYIFDSIQNVFGTDIASKMFLMVTFCDGQNPPVISAVKEAEIPYGKLFKFNNSSLYAKPATEGFSKLFWNLGTESFSVFFNELARIDPTSLQLSKYVLHERHRLESLLEGLQENISDGLDKFNVISKEEEILKWQEREKEINENYTYEVTVKKHEFCRLSSDLKALNCRKCFATCHYPCDREEDDQINCVTMNERGSSNATCNICQCSWEDHVIQQYRYRTYKAKETRTIRELKARYESASNRIQKAKDVINRLEEDLSKMQQDIVNKIKQARECKQRLSEIALKPGKLTEVDYINLLILTEEKEKKDGYLERIETLRKVKKAAEIFVQLDEKSSQVNKESTSGWWSSFHKKEQQIPELEVESEPVDRQDEARDTTDSTETPPEVPGKVRSQPAAVYVTQNNIVLTWNEPVCGADLVKRYYISYQDKNGESRKVTVEGISRVASIDGLEPDTWYTFKVVPEGKFGTGPESDPSYAIRTNKLLSKHFVEHSVLVSSSEDQPHIYALPLKSVINQTGNGKNAAKYVIGDPPPQSFNEKVLMLVGATGAGKTTLLNGIANYILGVHLEDNFRFKVDTDDATVSEVHSQTSCITAYTFYPMQGSPLPYPLTVIDSPGFGDTRGITRDEEIVGQIHTFFSTAEEYGIDHLDGVGIVLQAPITRLTPTQQYIFDSILSIFGKDISSKIILMTTFSDTEHPPVLSAVEAANIPYQSIFKFNNSSLFTKPTSTGFNKLFWSLGMESFSALFTEFGQSEPVSLCLTKEVLMERQHLEALLQGLQDKIATGLDKVNELSIEENILKEHEMEMQANKNFTYEINTTKRKSVRLHSDGKALNCRKCFLTCYYPCDKEEGEQFDCVVMNERGSSNATCNVCSSKCSWSDHIVQRFRYEPCAEMELRTTASLKERYEIAKGKYDETKEIIKRLEEDLSKMQQDAMKMIRKARECKQRLNEIALKPGKLTEIDYIDLLIVTEESEKKYGYLERIKVLEELKKAAMLLNTSLAQLSARESEDTVEWWTKFRAESIVRPQN